MDLIYLDNAATSFPKPEDTYVFMDRCFIPSRRGCYEGDYRPTGCAWLPITRMRSLSHSFWSSIQPSSACIILVWHRIHSMS